MANKTYQARVQSKIDTSQNWAKATNFVPLKGEICIYSDLHRMKVGDGTTKINDLDFFETVASSTTLGSIKADAKTENDTVPARIDADGKLWVKVPDAPLIVTATNIEHNTGTISYTGTIDYSESEILAAVSAGREVYLRGGIEGITLVFAFGGIFQGHVFFYNIFYMGLATGAMLAMVEGNQVYVNNAGFATSDDLDMFENTIKPQLLPKVTDADNNKILKVVNGAWAASALDKNSFVVNFTLSEDKATATADKTTDEIDSALQKGQTVVGVLSYSNSLSYLLSLNETSSSVMYIFSTTVALNAKSVQTIRLSYNIIDKNYQFLDINVDIDESFTDTEIETFYNANA